MRAVARWALLLAAAGLVLVLAGRVAIAGRVPILAPLACSAHGGTWYGAPEPLLGVYAAGCYRVPRG